MTEPAVLGDDEIEQRWVNCMSIRPLTFREAVAQEQYQRRRLHQLIAVLVILSLWQSLHLIVASL